MPRPGLARLRAHPVTRVAVRVLTCPATWVALTAFGLYLPIALTVLQLGPDPVDYLDLGRNLAAGRGYLLSTKAYFLEGSGVVHDGLSQRAPLFPLLISAIFLAGFDSYAVQVVNAALTAGCAALVYRLAAEISGRRTALLAGLAAAFSPAVLIHTILPMTEPLAAVLTLLSIWLLFRSRQEPRALPFALAGAALGLAYLTRPATSIMAAALILGLTLTAPSRRRLVRPLVALVLGAAPFVVPISVLSLESRGSLSYLSDSWYSVLQDADLITNSTLQPVPRPLDFVRANPSGVANAIVAMSLDYLGLLFLDRRWLLPLLPGLLVSLIALFRGRYSGGVWLLLLLALVNFVTYCLTWSIFARRYQLLTLLLLLPFAVDGLVRALGRWKLSRWVWFGLPELALALCLMVWLPTFFQQYSGTFQEAGGGDPVGTRTYGGVRWTGPPSWVEDRDLRPVFDWIIQTTAADDVLAGRSPHLMKFFTGRPGAQLPRRLDAVTLRRFLTDYQVAYVLLNNVDGYRVRYQGDLENLAPLGVGEVAIGAYRIYDTRPLWR